MQNVFKLDALSSALLKTDPYPYFTVDSAIDSDKVDDIIKAFPSINDGGSYNIDDVEMHPTFKSLIDSIDTPEFRRIICDKFDVQVMELPMMITLRGYSRKKDGRIHTDSKTKVATILIYLNQEWPAETGRLRVLRSEHDMEDYVEEIAPGPGSLLAFKVTDNCWHGYPSFEGKRQSIQINFLTSQAAGNKHRFFHRLSARLKSLFK
ncbi:2OG-Fe(II) oxygenase [Methylophaga sp.]|uniref:2OG-Fe(II) oxygenase n=1 Tax=Methylophaga sp. TaxID=2024840 RepID=UPI0013FF423C|nr:2OG-Fe(II) oxygenase [Methylophaga sp.]MTI62438.1 2OG-Fe(II) oxygenase [Methylophaga sp.]